MKKLDTGGFSIVEALVILVIVGAIGGLGFYVYNQGKETKTSQSYPNNSNNESSNDEKKADLPDVTTTLEIKEWGVKLDVKGATDPIYKIQDGVAWISTASFENTDECKKAAAELKDLEGGPYPPYFQGIAKLKASDKSYGAYPDDKETMADLYAQKNETVIKIGEDFYNYTHGNGMACSNDPRPDFSEAFKTLRKV